MFTQDDYEDDYDPEDDGPEAKMFREHINRKPNERVNRYRPNANGPEGERPEIAEKNTCPCCNGLGYINVAKEAK